ncbi:hypothetical protein BDV32DRAFT_143440 [Aspergillus pseudonomiae]|nr:hypothetical protein BDV32DRAFT_143440 [Aspergillus pseudonomiae]
MLNTEIRCIKLSTISIEIYTNGLSTHTSDGQSPKNYTITDSEEQDPRTYIQCPFSHDLLSIRDYEWCGQPPSISEGHIPSQSYYYPPSISAANEYGEKLSPHFPISLALDTSATFNIDTGFDHTIMAEGNQPSQEDQTPAEELALASSMIEPYYPDSKGFDRMDSGKWPVIPLAGSNGRNTASVNTLVSIDQSIILGYGKEIIQNWVIGHYH